MGRDLPGSVHPGLFTDESYMSLSMTARAECVARPLDGMRRCGVFEWKPLVLKAKIFPADNLNMNDVLSEIAAAGCIMRIEVDGKGYGLCPQFSQVPAPRKLEVPPSAPRRIPFLCWLVANQSSNLSPTSRRLFREILRRGRRKEGWIRRMKEREKTRRARKSRKVIGRRQTPSLKGQIVPDHELEDGFLSNVAQLDRLTAEQKAQFKAIADRWKGKSGVANAPPVKLRSSTPHPDRQNSRPGTGICEQRSGETRHGTARAVGGLTARFQHQQIGRKQRERYRLAFNHRRSASKDRWLLLYGKPDDTNQLSFISREFTRAITIQ